MHQYNLAHRTDETLIAHLRENITATDIDLLDDALEELDGMTEDAASA